MIGKDIMSTENSALVFNTVFLSRKPPTDTKIPELASWGKKLMQRGSVKNTEGNLSFRTRLGFIISGANVPLDALTPETVAEVTGVVYGLNKTSVYVKGMAAPSTKQFSIPKSMIYFQKSTRFSTPR